MACSSGALQRMLMNLGHKKTQRLNWVLLNSAGVNRQVITLQSVKHTGIRLTELLILDIKFFVSNIVLTKGLIRMMSI